MSDGSSLAGRLALRFVFQPLARWRESRLPDEDLVLPLGELRMKVFPPRRNRVSRALLEQGVWEPEVTGAIRALVRPGWRVLDIGGDAGYHTLLFAQAVGPQGSVQVFEPIPAAQQRIQENVALNGFQNVTLHPFALGVEKGSFVLERPLEASRLNPGKTAAGEGDIQVKVERFDDLPPEITAVRADLVKVDVEGAELEVLRGMEAFVAAHRPAFVLELHPDMLPLFGATVGDVLTWLEQRGYQLIPLDGWDISATRATTLLARPA